MPTVVTTSSASTATAYSNQRKVDRCQNGVLWSMFWDGTGSTLNSFMFSNSSDNGATWSAPGDSFGFVGDGANHTPNASFFIDLDDYAHVVYKDRHDGYIYYRRGTPNAGRTAWTWSAATRAGSADAQDNYPDVIAHREGTGWKAHIVYSRAQTDNYVSVGYRRFNVATDGTVTTDVWGNIKDPYIQSGAPHLYPSIDFNHTGDGKTIAGGTPHLYAAWSAGATGAGKGIRFRKATYSAGAWTWGTEREIDSTRYVANAYEWLNCLFDGTAAIMGGELKGATSADVVLWQRDAADTATTTLVAETEVTSSAGTAVNYGSLSYDATRNVYLAGTQSTTPHQVMHRKFTRASGTIGSTVVVDSAGIDSATARPTVKRGYSNGRIEFIYTDGTASPYSVTYGAVLLNTAPNAAALTSLTGGEKIDRAIVNRANHTFSDPDSGDSQSKADHRWRIVGSSTWSTETIVSPNLFKDFAAGSLAAGDYERQVLVYDAQGVPAASWSALGFFTAADAPPAPTITDPVNNATVSTQSRSVTWSTPNQTNYQVQILDSANAVVYDTGDIQNSTDRSRTLSFPTNNVTRQIRVRIKNNGLWSAWTTITVTVSYTSPAAFTISIIAIDKSALGFSHAFSVDSVHPTPLSGEPTVNAEDIFVRVVGEVGDGVRVATNWAPSLAYEYLAPTAKIAYEFRVKAFGTNGTYTWSSWTAAPILSFGGVLLHDPASHSTTILSIQNNSQGASDSYKTEHSTTNYQGRELPVVEFGDTTDRSIDVDLVQSLSSEHIKLRDLVKRRSILCYRDGVGRKAYGIIGINEFQDAFYGADTSISFTEVEYSEAV